MEFRGGGTLGFTLAEVLITLGVISLVALLIIPQLIDKYNEKVTLHKVETAYSLLSNAYNALLFEYGTPDTWDGISPQKLRRENSLVIADYFSKKLNLGEPCVTVNSKCYLYINKTEYESLTGLKSVIWSNLFDIAVKMKDMTVVFYSGSAECRGWNAYAWENVTESSPYYHACGQIAVDINGSAKKSNRYGRDLFVFIYTDKKIIPQGTPPTPYYSLHSSCNPNMTSWNGSTNGSFCTAWLLIKKNMDYLRKEVKW